MRKSVLAAAALSGLLLLSGCASYIQGGDLVRPGEPTGTLRIVNDGGLPISVVLISACSHSTYGLNRLPDDYQIEIGKSHDFTLSAGCWDVSAGTPTGAMAWVEGRKKITIYAGRTLELTSN
jgi:hypothetical protein